MKKLIKESRFDAFLTNSAAMILISVGLFVVFRLVIVDDDQVQLLGLDASTANRYGMTVVIGILFLVALWLIWGSIRSHARSELAQYIIDRSAEGTPTFDGSVQESIANRLEETIRRFVRGDIGVAIPDNSREKAAGKERSFASKRDREDIESALRQAERRYQDLFDSPVIMTIVTHFKSDGLPVIIDCNDAFASAMGYRRDELLGKPSGDFFTAESRRLMQEGGYQRALQGNLSAEERELVTKDGKIISVLVSGVPQKDKNGRTIGNLAVYMDISDRKRAERLLADERRLMRTLLDTLPDAIYAKDTQSRFTLANAAFARHRGLAGHEDALGKTDFDFFPKELAEQYYQLEYAILQSGKPMIDHEGQVVRNDGLPHWALTSKVPLRNGEGNVVGLVGVTRDITKRYQAEQALLKSETKHRMLVEAIPDAIWHINREGTLLDYKPAKNDVMQFPIAQHIGKRIDQIPEFPAGAKVFQRVTEAFETSASVTFEYQLNLRNAALDFEARVVPGGDDDALVIVRDISDRKRLDRLKNEFVSIVSHELRTPLTSIRGSLGLITGGVAGQISAQATSLVNIAYKNSERLIRLVNDILDIEKMESGKLIMDLKPVELMPILDQAIEATRAYGEQFGVKYVLGKCDPDIHIKADADRIIQVVTNLLSNAAKFSRKGSQVELSVLKCNSSVRVSVRDHGSGIPEEFQSRIFQKFSQANSGDTRQRTGSGLGLNICKLIVERLGGTIGFETAPNLGTTFFFDLPVLRDPTCDLTPIRAAQTANARLQR